MTTAYSAITCQCVVVSALECQLEVSKSQTSTTPRWKTRRRGITGKVKQWINVHRGLRSHSTFNRMWDNKRTIKNIFSFLARALQLPQSQHSNQSTPLSLWVKPLLFSPPIPPFSLLRIYPPRIGALLL